MTETSANDTKSARDGNHVALDKRELDRMETVCRNKVRQLASTLDLRRIDTIEALCAALATHLGRPIYLEACAMPLNCSGLWIADSTTDYIFYAQDTAPAHQQQIILHEIAHILCGHRSLTEHREGVRSDWFPHLPPQAIRDMLSRAQYDTREEREAELLATLLDQHWRHARTRHNTTHDRALQPAIEWLHQQTDEKE